MKDAIGFLFFLGLVGIIVLAVFASCLSDAEKKKKIKELMAECLKDGHKEYECFGYLEQPENKTTIIPMYMGK